MAPKTKTISVDCMGELLERTAHEFNRVFQGRKHSVARALRLSDKAVELGYDDVASGGAEAFRAKVVAMLEELNMHPWDGPVVQMVGLLSPLAPEFAKAHSVLQELEAAFARIKWYEGTYAGVFKFHGAFRRTVSMSRKEMEKAIKQDQRGVGPRAFTQFLTVERGERVFDVEKVERGLALNATMFEVSELQKMMWRLHGHLPDEIVDFTFAEDKKSGEFEMHTFEDIADALALHHHSLLEFWQKPPAFDAIRSCEPKAKKQRLAIKQ